MADVIKFPVGKSIGRAVVEFFEKQLARCQTDVEREGVEVEIRKFLLRMHLLKMVLDAGFRPDEFLTDIRAVEEGGE